MNMLQRAMAETDRAINEAHAEPMARMQAEATAEADEIRRVSESAVAAALAAHKLPQDEEQLRQRNLDAALADAIEVVARQRARLGRRICSLHDGTTTRLIHDALRGMLAASANDPGFP
jgi:lysyl-tRNA synthetase class II